MAQTSVLQSRPNLVRILAFGHEVYCWDVRSLSVARMSFSVLSLVHSQDACSRLHHREGCSLIFHLRPYCHLIHFLVHFLPFGYSTGFYPKHYLQNPIPSCATRTIRSQVIQEQQPVTKQFHHLSVVFNRLQLSDLVAGYQNQYSSMTSPVSNPQSSSSIASQMVLESSKAAGLLYSTSNLLNS